MPRSPLAHLLFALALVTCSACRSGAAASSNLDVLLDSNDRLRHLAPVQSPFTYTLAKLTPQNLFRKDSLLSVDRKQVKVGDPSYRALKELIMLAESGGFTNRHQADIQRVRQFSRYAVRCRGRLAREYALLALVPHAQRLGLPEPIREPEMAANAPELGEAIKSLVQVSGPALRANPSDTELTDLAAACQVVADLDMDIDGLWRALRALAALSEARNFERESMTSLRALSEDLQRRACAQALATGLSQEADPLVRAAAYEANYHVFGELFLAEAIMTLIPPGQITPVLPRGRIFGLYTPLPTDELVFVRTLDLARTHGLPIPNDAPEPMRIDARIQLIDVLVTIAREHRVYEDRPRTAAMLALSAYVGEDPPILRMEEWVRWWRNVLPSEIAAYEALVGSSKRGASESQEPTP
tara:strand:- start:11545 stop:12786 length:1242 start_codon:yes stop_codon:yes gene_type:complete